MLHGRSGSDHRLHADHSHGMLWTGFGTYGLLSRAKLCPMQEEGFVYHYLALLYEVSGNKSFPSGFRTSRYSNFPPDYGCSVGGSAWVVTVGITGG